MYFQEQGHWPPLVPELSQICGSFLMGYFIMILGISGGKHGTSMEIQKKTYLSYPPNMKHPSINHGLAGDLHLFGTIYGYV